MQWNPVELFKEAKQFALEVRSEYKKVTWPTQKETVGGTIGVIVIVAIITSVLAIVNLVLGQVFQHMMP